MMQEYWITEYGAVADGVTNCAAAIQAAVDAAAQAGGGRVMVPAGRFLSGSVMLRSHVELHLCSGAVLQSSLRPEDIRPFRHADADDAMDGWNGGFFLGACGGQDITISGSGVIDGQGRRVFFDRNEDNGFGECPKAAAAFRPRMILLEGHHRPDDPGRDAAGCGFLDAAHGGMPPRAHPGHPHSQRRPGRQQRRH